MILDVFEGVLKTVTQLYGIQHYTNLHDQLQSRNKEIHAKYLSGMAQFCRIEEVRYQVTAGDLIGSPTFNDVT